MTENTNTDVMEQSSSLRDNALEGWTKSEKFELLQGLKNVGSHDLSALISMIPTKSAEQIQFAIDYYKERALRSSEYTALKGKGKNYLGKNQRVPLSSWAKLLTDTYKYDELQTVTADALRLIAEFENIPHPVCTEYIDFQKAYHMLANAMEGKNLQEDKLLPLLINKCIIETALVGRSFIRKSILRSIIENINLSDKEIKGFVKPAEDQELAVLLHLAAQKNFNPLKISEDYLKPSKN